jgi:hypothetical protein
MMEDLESTLASGKKKPLVKPVITPAHIAH